MCGQDWAWKRSSCCREGFCWEDNADTHGLLQKAFSVAKIEHAEVMDETGKQKIGGLMDPKMGSMFCSVPPDKSVPLTPP
jgi:hypothetical protein